MCLVLEDDDPFYACFVFQLYNQTMESEFQMYLDSKYGFEAKFYSSIQYVCQSIQCNLVCIIDFVLLLSLIKDFFMQ